MPFAIAFAIGLLSHFLLFKALVLRGRARLGTGVHDGGLYHHVQRRDKDIHEGVWMGDGSILNNASDRRLVRNKTRGNSSIDRRRRQWLNT